MKIRDILQEQPRLAALAIAEGTGLATIEQDSVDGKEFKSLATWLAYFIAAHRGELETAGRLGLWLEALRYFEELENYGLQSVLDKSKPALLDYSWLSAGELICKTLPSHLAQSWALTVVRNGGCGARSTPAAVLNPCADLTSALRRTLDYSNTPAGHYYWSMVERASDLSSIPEWPAEGDARNALSLRLLKMTQPLMEALASGRCNGLNSDLFFDVIIEVVENWGAFVLDMRDSLPDNVDSDLFLMSMLDIKARASRYKEWISQSSVLAQHE